MLKTPKLRERVKQHCRLQSAFERLKEKYGNSPCEPVLTRFYAEIARFFRNEETSKRLDVLTTINARARDAGETVFAFGMERASLVAYLFGAINENPLPLHYYCEKCKRTEFIPERNLLPWDLPPKPCSCGGEMVADGYGIPFEAYEDLVTAPRICTTTRFAEELDEAFGSDVMICPIENLDILQRIQEEAGVPTDGEILASEITPATLAAVLNTFYGIPTGFTKSFMKLTKPKTFFGLLQLFGLAQSKGGWYDNAEKLIREGRCGLSDIPAHHDDVLMQVQERIDSSGKADNGFAHHIAALTRYREFAKEGEEEETKLKELGFEDHFWEYLKKATLLYPRAYSVVYVRQALLFHWYKINFPDILNKHGAP